MSFDERLPVNMDQWAASIAHEVNQPLAAIVSNAEACLAWLLKEQPDLDRARKAAERIVRTSCHARDTMRSIRMLLRRLPPERVALDVNALVEEVLDLMWVEIREHDVKLEVQLSRDAGLLSADRIQLQQLLVNLIRNAIEAMCEASVTAPRTLHVSTSIDSDGCAQIAVADSGPGLDDATLARIFEPFFTTKSTGMGLGLSICRAIAESHGGRLCATRRQPRGSIFAFTLPIHGASVNSNQGRSAAN